MRPRAFSRGLTNPGADDPRATCWSSPTERREREIPLELRNVATGCGMRPQRRRDRRRPARRARPRPPRWRCRPGAETPQPSATGRPGSTSARRRRASRSRSTRRRIQQEGTTRIAWFRMTDPESGQPTLNSYRLRIDCSNRMYAPLALAPLRRGRRDRRLARLRQPRSRRRRRSRRGTVTEIAFLSLCT